MSEDHDIPELADAEKIRVRAMVSDMTEMAAGLRAGTATPEDVAGGVARNMSVDVDRDTMLNALHIPTDAGPFTPALETILRRIPDGWGRWISPTPAGTRSWSALMSACPRSTPQRYR